MQGKLLEDKRHDGVKGVTHQALAGKVLADPVADAARHGDAALDVAQVDAADQGMVVTPQDEKAVADVVPRFPCLAAQAAAYERVLIARVEREQLALAGGAP